MAIKKRNDISIKAHAIRTRCCGMCSRREDRLIQPLSEILFFVHNRVNNLFDEYYYARVCKTCWAKHIDYGEQHTERAPKYCDVCSEIFQTEDFVMCLMYRSTSRVWMHERCFKTESGIRIRKFIKNELHHL